MPYPLPEDPEPSNWICVSLMIPDEETFKRNFTGHIHQLTRWFNHDRDTAHTAKKVAETWMIAFLSMTMEDCNLAACCPTDGRNFRRIISAMNNNQSQWLNMLDDGESNQSFAPGSPEQFDHDPADDTSDKVMARQRALCEAVRRYVYSVLENVANANLAVELIETALSQFPPFGILFGIVDMFTDIGQTALTNLLADQDAIKEVICKMVNNLKGKPVTHADFRDAADPSQFEALSNPYQIAVLIDISTATVANYRAFVSIMDEEYQRLFNGGAHEDCCGCEDEIVLQDTVYGATITALGACNFRIQQGTPDGNGRYRASLSDILNRCLKFDYPDEPHVLQGISGSTVVGCCGTPDYNGENFGGGFIPTNGVINVNWWGTEPIDTVFKVTLFEGECL